MPLEADVVEFEANVESDWVFHCRILYHMMNSMGRVFGYENQEPNPLNPNLEFALRN